MSERGAWRLAAMLAWLAVGLFSIAYLHTPLNIIGIIVAWTMILACGLWPDNRLDNSR